MSSLFLAITFMVVGMAAFLAGLKGLYVGQKTAQEQGPNTLIHYPAPIPWLRSKVSSARWVSWIGRLYSATGLVLITLGAINLGQDTSDPRLAPCISLLDTISPETQIHTPIIRQPDTEDQIGCQISVIDSDQVIWLTVSSTPTNTLIGDNFGHQTQELARKGFDVTKIAISERRSALARAPSEGNSGPVLIVEDSDGCNTIEFNPNVTSEALIEQTISSLRSKQSGKLPSAM
ncbi:MAG: hypothetical protein CL930_15120 [Deltaproteobacteria bacterium]|nr:hypothetical protein [Deltaproteobacteria bacterium]|tara:strand:- start:143 stop:841 length:699 start_codon:yes stop_codon:yes gene_type:complete